MQEIWNIIWQNEPFHWVTAAVLVIATTWEIYTVIKYCTQSNNDKKAIEQLKRNGTTHKNRDWINEHLETENNQPIQDNNGKYLLKQYPEILTHATRSNLRFVGTLCTAIGVLGTFYGIQQGISNIALNDLNDTQSLLSGVSGLLEGMKTAFSTSLMGLGSGSLFTFVLFITDSIRQSQHDAISRSLHKITVTGKDTRQDAVNSLQEIADTFKQFDFTANQRTTKVLLETVVQNLNARSIGQEVGNAVSSQIDTTIETRLTPVFTQIANSQKILTQMTTKQTGVLSNLIGEMRTELITPVVERLDQSARLTQQASEAVTELNNELGGISKKLATSVTTIQQFQQETLEELKSFANSLQSILTDFQTDTKGVLEQTATSINHAVSESIKGMESQRQAFQESANQASDTFRGIREDLEQSLQTQAEQQQQMLTTVSDRISEILNQTNESFKTKTQTLSTVGKQAALLMNNAKENLEQTLTNIDGTLQQTRLTVQEELENFRSEYQNSLNQFFEQQNQLLEGSLGQQRDALSEVVNDLRNAFTEEIEQRQVLITDLNNTITHLNNTIPQVKESIDQINQVSIAIHNRVRDIQELTAAMGLNSADRLTQLQELSHGIGTATQDFNNLLHKWQNHLNQYIDTSTQWQTNFFKEADSSMARVCSGLLETANVLVTIEQERKLR